MTHCTIDLRESVPPAIQETIRLLCAQELEEWMREHFTAVKLEAKTKHNDCC
jgi:hypothetical protein